MFIRTRTRQVPSRGGHTTVEFSIVAVVFCMFFFGIFEYTRYVFIQNLMNQAAREGARFAVVSAASSTSTYNGGAVTTAQMTAVVQQYTDQFLVGQGKNNIVGYPASPPPLPAISAGTFTNFIQVFYIDVNGANQPDWYDAAAGQLMGVSFADTNYNKLNYKPVTPALLLLPNTIPIGSTCLMFCEAN